MDRKKRPETNLPSAVKHGAFCKIAFFPGEDPREFRRLHSELVIEWKPNGPTQQDAVLTLAKLLWRKQRIQIYIAARAAERENSREQAVRFALGVLRVDPDSVAQVLRMCPENIGRALEKKLPRGNYATESDWHLAVREQLELILRWDLKPADGDLVVPQDPFASMFKPPNPLEISDEQLVDMELRTDERLETRIDYTIRRLLQLKASQQIMNSAHLEMYQPEPILLCKPTRSTSRTREKDEPAS
jgi:hypothetical protein